MIAVDSVDLKMPSFVPAYKNPYASIDNERTLGLVSPESIFDHARPLLADVNTPAEVPAKI